MIDLTRLTERRATERMRTEARSAATACVRLRVDRAGEAVFAREPRGATLGVLLAAALSACAEQPEPRAETELVEPLTAPTAPQTAAIDAAPPVATRQVDVVLPEDDAEPDPAQRALTARKRAARTPVVPHHEIAGMMVIEP